MKIHNFYLCTILLISCLQENDGKPKIYPVIRNLRWIFHSNPGFYLDRIFYTRKLGLIFMTVIIWKQFSQKYFQIGERFGGLTVQQRFEKAKKDLTETQDKHKTKMIELEQKYDKIQTQISNFE